MQVSFGILVAQSKLCHVTKGVIYLCVIGNYFLLKNWRGSFLTIVAAYTVRYMWIDRNKRFKCT